MIHGSLPCGEMLGLKAGFELQAHLAGNAHLILGRFLAKLPHLFQSIQTAAIFNSALIPQPGNLQLMH